MIAELIRNHQVVSVLLIASLSIVVGLIEHIGFRRTDLACITWFCGVVVVSIASMGIEELGQFRLPIGILSLVAGSLLIATIYMRK